MNAYEPTGNKPATGFRRDLCRNCRAGIVLLTLLFGAQNLWGAEIDRLLVAVNGSVITEGDLYIARKLNPLIFSVDMGSALTRDAEIDAMIDLVLIRQELESFSIESVDESAIEARVGKWRDRLGGTGGIANLLGRLGIRESELNSFIRLRVSILEFVAFRFGPYARVTQGDIEQYYKGRLTPQLRESGLEPPPLEQVSADIAEIIRNDKINDALDEWIADARRNARIEYFNRDGPVASEAGKQPAGAQSRARE